MKRAFLAALLAVGGLVSYSSVSSADQPTAPSVDAPYAKAASNLGMTSEDLRLAMTSAVNDPSSHVAQRYYRGGYYGYNRPYYGYGYRNYGYRPYYGGYGYNNYYGGYRGAGVGIGGNRVGVYVRPFGGRYW
jgi:hypothetical protein